MSLMVLPHLTHQPSPAGRVAISRSFLARCGIPPHSTRNSVGCHWNAGVTGLRSPKVMKHTSVRQPLPIEPLPFLCHPDRSEAERRDLRFRGPFMGMFFGPWRNLQLPKEPPKLHANQGEGNSMSETRNTHHD
jgi:hypothetical protein